LRLCNQVLRWVVAGLIAVAATTALADLPEMRTGVGPGPSPADLPSLLLRLAPADAVSTGLLRPSSPALPTTAAVGDRPGEGGAGGAPEEVIVGFYPTTIYDIDIGTSTYQVAAYVWFRWTGDIDPSETAEFVNAVENWGLTKEKIFAEPQVRADGTKYQILQLQGRFFQAFSLADFPLDRQTLTITIEDSAHTAERIVYRVDRAESGIGDRLKVPGWKIGAVDVEAGEHTYNTSFGEEAGGSSRYATATFSLSIHRPVTFFLLKFLLPLCIVLIANWTVFLMQPRLIEVRTALPTTALLTTMFLQQSYSASYLILIDKIYAVAYAMIVATLISVILTSRHVKPTTETTGFSRRDLTLLASQVVIFAALTTAILVSR
jgi:hypothetical protein